jgi:hypothetical protein
MDVFEHKTNVFDREVGLSLQMTDAESEKHGSWEQGNDSYQYK